MSAPAHAVGQTSGFGDGAIAGVVRDVDGLVLPGVSVEASSPVLIERVRTDVTDDSGRYEIRGLRPGVYTLTFTRTTHQTTKRAEITVEGSAVRTVNTEMRLGPFTDGTSVTAAVPLIDVRSTTRQTVYSGELLDSFPTARSPNGIAVLVPGVDSSARDVGDSRGHVRAFMTTHGGRPDDQRITVGGFSSGVPISQAASNLVPNPEAAEEVVIETAASGAEAPTGGISINFLPRAGGNTTRGSLFFAGSSGRLQGRNLTRALADQGATASPEALDALWDVNPGVGGPIRRDRLWYFGSLRRVVARVWTGQFYNQNAFLPDNYTFMPDVQRRARSVDGRWTDVQGRVTWTINADNTLAVTLGDQRRCNCPTFITPTRAPEAGVNDRNPVQRTYQADWRLAVSSKLLIEVAAQHRDVEHGHFPLTLDDSGVDEDRFAGYADSIGVTVTNGQGLVPNNFVFHGPGPADNMSGGGQFHFSRRPTYSMRASATLEHGRHLIKVGAQQTSGYADQRAYSISADRYGRAVRYIFTTLETPRSVTIFSGTPEAPWYTRNNLNNDMGVYVQDRLTASRLTASVGLRIDLFRSSYPEQTIPATVFGRPAATLPAGTSLDWKDWTPRLAASYDLTGDAKNAVKVSLNKYVESQSLAGIAISANPLAGGRGIVNNYTRNWKDSNQDFVVDCDVAATPPNGECTNAIATNVLRTVPTPLNDASVRNGWGLRPFNWEFSLGLQRELLRGVAFDISYVRRGFGNFSAVDDRACVDATARTGCRDSANYRPYDISVPVDSRLPRGGGYTLSGFVDFDCARPESNCGTATAGDVAALTPDNARIMVRDIGATQVENWNGVDVSVSMRRYGVSMTAGTSTGRRYTNECDVWRRLPEVQGLGRPLAACEVVEPFRTSVKGAAAYTLPRLGAGPAWLAAVVADVQLGATFQSIPGNEMSADYSMVNVEFATPCPSTTAGASCSTLGRFLANTGAPGDPRSVAVLLPGTRYDTRHHQLDVKLSKLIRRGGARVGLSLIVFNALNASPVLTRNNLLGRSSAPGIYPASQQQQADGSYNSLWVPTGILQPRFAAFSMTVDF